MQKLACRAQVIINEEEVFKKLFNSKKLKKKKQTTTVLRCLNTCVSYVNVICCFLWFLLKIKVSGAWKAHAVQNTTTTTKKY